MQLGRVLGTVVASRKTEGLEGIRLLYVIALDEQGDDRGDPFVAADTTQAGPGDLVHLTGSREAALAMPEPFVPVDAAILAIVDHVGDRSAADLLSTAKPARKRPSKRKEAAR